MIKTNYFKSLYRSIKVDIMQTGFRKEHYDRLAEIFEELLDDAEEANEVIQDLEEELENEESSFKD